MAAGLMDLEFLDGEEEGFGGVDILDVLFGSEFKEDGSEAGGVDKTVGLVEQLRRHYLVQVPEDGHQLIIISSTQNKQSLTEPPFLYSAPSQPELPLQLLSHLFPVLYPLLALQQLLDVVPVLCRFADPHQF